MNRNITQTHISRMGFGADVGTEVGAEVGADVDVDVSATDVILTVIGITIAAVRSTDPQMRAIARYFILSLEQGAHTFPFRIDIL